MQTKIEVSAIFHCSLERAFRTPILGDATKILTGYLVVPAVTHFTEDTTWGQVDGYRIPQAKKSIFSKGGAVGADTIFVRTENKYWKWAVHDLTTWMVWLERLQGELFFEDKLDGSISVRWVYTLSAKDSLFKTPLQILFAKIFWKGQMRKGIKNMKHLAETKSPYLYE